jgi:hypothetical protein
MMERALQRFLKVWASEGPIGVARRVAEQARYNVDRLTQAFRRSALTLRNEFTASGVPGVSRRILDGVRLGIARLTGRGQSEDELLATSQRYWNEGDIDGIDLKDYSHWEGSGPWQDREKWLALGRVHFEMYKTLCLVTGTNRPPKRMIEWGSGGGANAIHFVKEVDHFCGVEIAQASLDECRRVLREAAYESFEPILISASEPEQVLGLAQGAYDFFLSTYVFELIPSKSYGERVCRIAYELLKPGGLGLIQIRYDDGSERSKQKHADYFRHSSRFTSYRVEEFWILLHEIGFHPQSVFLVPNRVEPFSGDLYAYFSFVKPATISRQCETESVRDA